MYMLKCKVDTDTFEYNKFLDRNLTISIQNKEFQSRLTGNYSNREDEIDESCCYAIIYYFKFAGFEYITSPITCFCKEHANYYIQQT